MSTWIYVCAVSDLIPELGVPALVSGQQVALFQLADESIFAVQQKDPYSGANVLSRGIVGTVGDVATVTSPMYKQVWSLATGDCLDPVGKEPKNLETYLVRVVDEGVEVSLD